MKTANGFRGVENGTADSGLIEPDQRAIPFLNLYNAILNSHGQMVIRNPVTGTEKKNVGNGPCLRRISN